MSERRLLSIAPQFLVADLQRALAYYTETLGFTQAIGYEDFYASVRRDQAEIHLKRAKPLAAERSYRQENAHIDAYITVTNLEHYFAECRERGAIVHQEVQSHPWSVTDFCLMDPDGYILCFADVD
ncbi:MAG: VOC family protein [Pseudomonadota bacterium]